MPNTAARMRPRLVRRGWPQPLPRCRHRYIVRPSPFTSMAIRLSHRPQNTRPESKSLPRGRPGTKPLCAALNSSGDTRGSWTPGNHSTHQGTPLRSLRHCLDVAVPMPTRRSFTVSDSNTSPRPARTQTRFAIPTVRRSTSSDRTSTSPGRRTDPGRLIGQESGFGWMAISRT